MANECALYRASDVRELDRRAIEDCGIAALTLMERAGAALFGALRDHFPAAERVLVLCGGGNNGGDGYVLARRAREAGLQIRLCALAEPGKLQGAAAEAAAAWRAAGGDMSEFDVALLQATDVVVDALLGTGLDRRVEGRYAQVVDSVNAAGVPVLSADIPSGLHADTGKVMGCAVRAAVTMTFIGFKAGMFTGDAAAYAGRIRFDNLDVPEAVHEGIAPLATRLDPGQLADWLPVRERTAHKGHFGHVLVLGGGRGMPGAVRLAGEAALRGGAGRVSAAAWPGNVAAIAANRPELMCHGMEDFSSLAGLLERIDVLALGPGLGLDAWAGEAWQAASEASVPRVIDADGLNWLARRPQPLSPRDVITPHPGEAARLLETSVAVVEADRFAAVRQLVEKFNAVTVLKGAGTLIGAPDGRIAVCARGNPGMATAGMGDVLTGLVGAFLGQRLAAFDAACAAVLVHALAGDRAARFGERGLLAGDLLRELRTIVNPGSRRREMS